MRWTGFQDRRSETRLSLGLMGAAAALLLWAGMAGPSRGADDGGLSPGYGPDTLTFETWCAEIRRMGPERCARRDPGDVEAFQVSLDRMHGFESEHQRQIRKDREFMETFDSIGRAQPSQWQ